LHPAKGSVLGYLYSALSLTWSGVICFSSFGILDRGRPFGKQRGGELFRCIYRRRVCRIFPLYYLVLEPISPPRAESGSGAFCVALRNAAAVLALATFTQNILTAKPDLPEVGWV